MDSIISAILEDRSSVWPAAVVTTVVAAVTYFLVSRRRDQPWPRVPGALPLVGNFHQVTVATLNIKLEEWATKYGADQGVFEMNLAGVRHIVPCREDRIKEILLQRPYKIIRNTQLTEAANSIGADGVFSAEGNVWKQDRRLVAPAFNHANVQDFVPNAMNVVERLVAYWKEFSGEAVVINDDCLRFSLDITAFATMGQDFDSLRKKGCLEAYHLKKCFAGGFARSLSPIPFWRIPIFGQYLDGVGWSRSSLLSSLSQLVDEVEVERDSAGRDADDSFVKKFVKHGLDRHRIVGNMLTIFVGAADSSASTLNSAILALALDETGLQEELFQECRGFDKSGDDITTQLTQLPRMQSFLLEIHRYYAAFPMQFFQTTEDAPFAGSLLKKNTLITVLIRYSQCHPTDPPEKVPLGPNKTHPSKFCPRRYLTGLGEQDGTTVNAPEKNSTAFLTFGYGSRVCLGKQFSDIILPLTLVEIVRTFEMKLTPNHEKVSQLMGFSAVPDRDVNVIFTER